MGGLCGFWEIAFPRKKIPGGNENLNILPFSISVRQARFKKRDVNVRPAAIPLTRIAVATANLIGWNDAMQRA